MKAVVHTQFGAPEVLHLAEVDAPAPGEKEVLVRVQASSVNFGDLLARDFASVTPGSFAMPALLWIPSRLAFGINKPRMPILGNEFSGVVEAVGGKVTQFRVGDAVFGYRGSKMGAYAEHIVMPEDGVITHKPGQMSFEEAAALPYGALMAYGLLKQAKIEPGQKVLILGASGGIGGYAVQLARHFGAEVTGVCGAPRMDLVRSLGAHKVIDYAREDFRQNGERYDLIFDIIHKTDFERCKGSLTSGGRYMLVSFKAPELLQMLWTSAFGRQKVICAMTAESREHLEIIRTLAEAGTIRAVVDRCYPMAQAAEAHHYAESGQRKASIVITMA